MKRLFLSCIIGIWAITGYAQTTLLQIGFGGAIASSQSDKMVGLHPAYPVGTRLLVKNKANGGTVVIKVIGALPQTAENEKLVIKLSQAACKAIKASGKRFSVELYTAPPENETVETYTEPTKDTTKIKVPENEIHHKVKTGETLYAISKKYKVTIDQIRTWNNLEKDVLRTGQKIKILKNY